MRRLARFFYPGTPIFPLVLLTAINFLFLYKYLARFTSWYLIGAAAYSLMFSLCLYWGVTRYSLQFTRRWMMTGLLTGILLYGGYLAYVPATRLQVDRWSAVTGFWDAVFAGCFPYAATTHLGHPIGPFPFFFLLAFPFYILGDVGYMALAGVLGLIVLLVWLNPDPRRWTILVLSVVGSPAVWWELAARSTLLPNMVVIIWYLFWLHRASTQSLAHPFRWGIGAGFLASTRSVVLLPLLAYGVYRFRMPTRWREARQWGLGFMLGLGFTFLPFIVWDWSQFLTCNPVTFQATRFLPLWVLPVILMGALAVGLKAPTFGTYCYAMSVGLFLIVCISLFEIVSQIGWTAAISQNGYDISYFLLAAPWLLVAISLSSNMDGEE